MTNARKTAALLAAAMLTAVLSAAVQEPSHVRTIGVSTSTDRRERAYGSHVELASFDRPISRESATTTTTEPPRPAPTRPQQKQSVEPAQQQTQVAVDSGGWTANWDAVADCESGGNWAINTGNGYYGGLQMNMDFWRSYGGGVADRPDHATPNQQKQAAENAKAVRGMSPWPVCGRRG